MRRVRGRQFSRSALRAALRPTAVRKRVFDPGFYGTPEGVPFRILCFDGDGQERSRLRAMPTSQKRDVGHPVLGRVSDVDHPPT
jgi:hypothetical protein